MIKQVYILLLVLFGAVMVPNKIVACGTQTERSCCSEKSSSEAKNCHKDSHSKNKKNNSCNGKCNHSTCSFSTTHFGIIPPFNSDLKPIFVWSEKQRFHYSVNTVSSVFLSIWAIPKIG
jgi:hypothetical protein